MKDLLGQEIKYGDVVVSYNHIYQILDLGNVQGKGFRHRDMVKLILVNRSKTTKPVWRHASEVCALPYNVVLRWLETQ